MNGIAYACSTCYGDRSTVVLPMAVPVTVCGRGQLRAAVRVW
jgi:hypothetical protein